MPCYTLRNMNINTWLTQSTAKLTACGIATARLDILVLMEDEIDRDRAWLLAHPEFELDEKSAQSLDKLIKRRAEHEPLAYIRGKSEFYGREFLVTPATLQPRAETETMIELLHKTDDKKLQIIDVGTGSGCLAITAKLEWPEAEVYATEINETTLKIAEQNAKKLKADVKFYNGNLLQPVLTIDYIKPTAVLANLPYVPNNNRVNKAAAHEPELAIFGGEDGLDLYRMLFSQIANIQSGRPQQIFTESLPFQHAKLTNIANKHGFELTRDEDFIQVFSLIALKTG